MTLLPRHFISTTFIFIVVSLCTINNAAARQVVVIVGDSTVTNALNNKDEAGWGWAMNEMAKGGVTVHNEAKGGRSSRSFRTEGRWGTALSHKPDWIMIQFGHNDMKGKGPERESDAATDYRKHLRQYIEDARETGAKPVLVTPVCRRTFNSNDQLIDRLEAYAEATRIVGRETNVPVIDLHAYSYRKFSEMGPEKAYALGPSDKEQDRTHFSRDASRIIASWVLSLMQESAPDLASNFEFPNLSAMPDINPLSQTLNSPQNAAPRLQEIEGPFPGTKGLIAQENTSSKVDLDVDAGEPLRQATVSFWFYLTESLLSGPENETWKETLVNSPGQFEISWGLNSQFLGFYFNWRGDFKDRAYVRCLIPGMKGPGWHHMAIIWDTTKGYHNIYLDGTLVQENTQSYERSNAAPIPQKLIVHFQKAGLWDVALYDRVLSQDEIKKMLTPLYFGSSDLLLGSKSLGKLELDKNSLDLIYSDDFTQEAKDGEWILEGPGLLTRDGDGLTMKSADPEGQMGHFVYWLDKKLPESFVAEWEVEILSPHGLNIVFFSASGPEEKSIFSPDLSARDGDFRQYHSGDFDNYHISYYANSPTEPGRSTSNLRKNSGFYLVSNGPQGIAPGSSESHIVTLVKNKAHIQLAVNGERVINWVDDGVTYGKVLGNGWFGMRQMQWTTGRYKNLKIYEMTAQ